MTEYVSQAELARAGGVTRQWVNKLVRDGRLKKNGKGKVSLEEGLSVLKMLEDPVRRDTKDSAPEEKPETVDDSLAEYKEVKTQKEKYAALSAKLEYDRRLGTLIPIDQVSEEFYRAFRDLRDALSHMPSRLADRIAAAPGVREITAAIDEEVRRVLAECAEKLKRYDDNHDGGGEAAAEYRRGADADETHAADAVGGTAPRVTERSLGECGALA